MKLVIQRVSEATVLVNGEVTGNINHGLLIFLGITHDDNEADIEWLINKVVNMRIFSDEKGLMNLSSIDINGAFLIVSQFTLFASTRKGNRPSFIDAAKPEVAIPLYKLFKKRLNEVSMLEVQEGVFGADMKVRLINDGPVTIILDSRNRI